MASFHPHAAGALSDTEFDRLRGCFESLGDRLSDDQMLDLADSYHALIRRRRELRARHPLRAPSDPAFARAG